MNSERPVIRVLSKLGKVKRMGSGWSARCPAHEDSSPSLSVGEGKDGCVLLTCHAGCTLDDILAAIGLSTSDLFASNGDAHTTRPVELEAYDYTDEEGTLLYQVVRFAPKTFKQRRPDGAGGWLWNLQGTRRVLYRLPAVLAAVARGDTIYVVEGEKDVAALEAAGEIATCNPGGAGKWRDEYAEAVRGANVVVVADRDAKGRTHAAEVAESLKAVTASVRVVQPFEGKDAHDHLLRGHTVEEFVDAGRIAKETEANDADVPIAEDGEVLLEELHSALTRYVVLPSSEAADAVTLWIAATHAQPAWNHAARLCAVSPIKQCGKSRLMDVVHATCFRPLITVNASIAAVVRSIGDKEPITRLVDEADTIFGTKKAAENNEDLRGILNAGHQRNRPYLRWDMTARNIEHTPTFAMAMLAAIRDLPDTIMDRAVVIRMRRRAPGETIASWRERTAPASFHDLRARLHAYVRAHLDELADAEPSMPVEDRAADTWEPLVAIADLAGGVWPQRARRACVSLTADASDEGSASERLLSDVRDVFGADDKLKTATLIDRLAAIEEAPWGDWHGKGLNARGLATLLKPYGVKSKNLRFAANDQAKGYELADFADPWARYLRAPSVPAVPASQEGESADEARDGSGTEAAAPIRPSREQGLPLFGDGGTAGTPPVGDAVDELGVATLLVQQELDGVVVSEINGQARRYRPERGELLAAASDRDFPRINLADGSTLLAGEDFWRVFSTVALPPQRQEAMAALAALNGPGDEASATPVPAPALPGVRCRPSQLLPAPQGRGQVPARLADDPQEGPDGGTPVPVLRGPGRGSRPHRPARGRRDRPAIELPSPMYAVSQLQDR